MLPSVFGIWHENQLKLKSRPMRLDTLVMKLVIVPIRLLVDRVKNFMFGSEWPIVDGQWLES